MTALDADRDDRHRRSRLALALLLLAAMLGAAGLAALGTWQLERRAWKLDLIRRVDSRVHAAPVAAPDRRNWPAINAADHEYLRVRATGLFLNDREALVQAVTERGPGYWVMTPLRLPDGAHILVNRGFVPANRRDRATRQSGDIVGEATVTGLLRLTEPAGFFLRANDPAADRWYSRDVDAIAAARGLRDVAPYFIDADATLNAPDRPVGGLTVIAFRNDHLVYAITWYALALMLAAGAAYLLYDRWQTRKAGTR